MTTAPPDDLRARLLDLAERRDGVLHRPEVLHAGIPRWVLQAELRVGRWQRTGPQTVVVHNGPLSARQRRAVAVLEVGPRAALDGLSALQHTGLDLDDDAAGVHVIAPKGSTPKHPRGVRVHESRRFHEDDVVVRHGVRCVQPAVAAVHGALWARSDRAARLLLVVVVQQGLATVEHLQDAVAQVRRSPRGRLLRATAADLRSGVRALGELDLARLLRRHGLPQPDRQVVRRRPSGRQYLDCRWDRYRVVLEVDGVQHAGAAQQAADAVRDLDLVADGDTVVRIPCTALVVDGDAVVRALARALEARGWGRAA